MRLFCARGIPTVMVGTRGLELAHAVDERVRVEELGDVGADDRAGGAGVQNFELRSEERVRAAAAAREAGVLDLPR